MFFTEGLIFCSYWHGGQSQLELAAGCFALLFVDLFNLPCLVTGTAAIGMSPALLTKYLDAAKDPADRRQRIEDIVGA